MSDLFLGMISGTSIDGVDAVLAEIGDTDFRIVDANTTPFPPDLHTRLGKLVETPQTSLRELGALDVAVGRFFAECALRLIASSGLRSKDVAAIGSHGQTVYHEPLGPEPFSLQLGDPNVIAAMMGTTTVADFRRLDVALGGQGAPLVPAFHAWRFGHAREQRVVVNIGGIANITVLAPGREVTGFDTGPGNTLLFDVWIRASKQQSYDDRGRWAAGGVVNRALLDVCLAEPFFGRGHRSRPVVNCSTASGSMHASRVAPAESLPSTCRRRSRSSGDDDRRGNTKRATQLPRGDRLRRRRPQRRSDGAALGRTHRNARHDDGFSRRAGRLGRRRCVRVARTRAPAMSRGQRADCDRRPPPRHTRRRILGSNPITPARPLRRAAWIRSTSDWPTITSTASCRSSIQLPRARAGPETRPCRCSSACGSSASPAPTSTSSSRSASRASSSASELASGPARARRPDARRSCCRPSAERRACWSIEQYRC